jgi:histidine kinase
MMKTFRGLGPRLLISHLLAIGTATGTFIVTFRLLAPEVFGRRIQGTSGPNGPGGPGGWGQQVRSTFESSVDTAILVSILVGAIAAAVVAWIMTRLLTRPVDDIRRTTHSLAQGNYEERVVEPAITELGDLARDVNELAAALESTETARAQLVSDLAHELRTPLTSINGYVEGAADGVFSHDEMLAAVTEETRRMRKLVDDLSLLSRAQEGVLALEMTDTDVTHLVGNVADRLRPQFESADVMLVVTGERAIARVDPARLGQVLTNIIGNALGHTPAGGTVTVETTASRTGVVVKVSDDGEGIPEEDLPHVFDRFYRGTTTDRAGSGIGLAIARSIIDAHGGVISARSAGPGTGATLTVELPA